MTATTPLETFRLADEVRRHARLRPGQPALSDVHVTRTYAELDSRTNRVAQALTAEGLRLGDRIAVLDRNSIDTIEILLGAAKAGVVVVPVNWRLTSTEMLGVLQDADAQLVVGHQEFRAHLDLIASDAPNRTLVVLGGDEHTHAGTAYNTWRAAHPDIDPGHDGGRDDPVLLMYTSGTTGVPKGVIGTNRNIAATTMCGSRWGLDADSVTLTAMPMFHIGGLSLILISLSAGAHSVIARDVVAADLLDSMEQRQVTATFLVPTVIASLLAEPDIGNRNLGSMRSMIYGASPITPALLRRAVQTFGCPLFQVYGLTETHGAICQLDPQDHDPDGPRQHLLHSAGKPYPWVELKTVDPSTGDSTARGTPGEIQVRGPNVTIGYHQRPDATAAAIDPDGWFRTGDIGSLDAEGYLTISDRLKDMVISGGENVYPREVEAVLADHPAVDAVAVIGIPDPRWGETVRAVVVRRAGSDCDGAQLIEYTRQHLAAYKCPKRVDFVDALPVGPTGKVLKRELRDSLLASEEHA